MTQLLGHAEDFLFVPVQHPQRNQGSGSVYGIAHIPFAVFQGEMLAGELEVFPEGVNLSRLQRPEGQGSAGFQIAFQAFFQPILHAENVAVIAKLPGKAGAFRPGRGKIRLGQCPCDGDSHGGEAHIAQKPITAQVKVEILAVGIRAENQGGFVGGGKGRQIGRAERRLNLPEGIKKFLDFPGAAQVDHGNGIHRLVVICRRAKAPHGKADNQDDGGNVHRDFLPVSRKAYPYGDGNQCQRDKAELPHPPPEGRGVGLNFLLLLLLFFDDVLGLLSGSGHRRLAVKEPGKEQKHSHH